MLAIDTALENCSVGLSIEGRLIAHERTIGRGHAEALMPAVAALFAEAGLSMRDVDRIAVSVGPGSFTGLRVGIAAARGLALVRAVPVVGVSTLRAHAETARLSRKADAERRPILALLPARGDELFGQLFSADAEPLDAPLAASVESFRALATERNADVVGAGAVRLGEGFAPLHDRSAPELQAIVALGLRLDPASNPPRPLYVKPPDAAPQNHARIARR